MYIIKVYQYNLNGDFIREYDAIIEAAHVNKIHHSQIIKGLSRKSGYACGFLWSKIFLFRMKPYKPLKTVSYSYRNIPVDQFSLNGAYLKTFDSITQAEKLLSISRGQISAGIRKRNGRASGYFWKLKD